MIGVTGTDGKTIYLNKNYLRALEEDEQVFVLSHEICHIGLNHILRSKDKDPRLWNIATDAVINRHLVKDGLPKVDNIVYKEDALNYDAEELYNKLLKEKQDKEQQGNQGNNQQQNNQDSQNDQAQNSQGQGQSSQNDDNSSNGQSQGDNNSQQEHNSKNNDNNSQGNNQTNGSQQQQSNQDSQNGQGQNGNNSQNNVTQNKNIQPSNGNQGDSQVGHDEHTMWEDAVKEYEKEQTQHSPNNDYKEKNSLKDKVKYKLKKQSENNGKEQENKKEKDTNESNKNGEQNQNFDGNKNQDSQNLGKDGIQQYVSEREFFKKNEEMKIKYAEEVMNKLSSESRGFGAGGQLATFKDIGKANKAVLNWKKVLKQTLEKEDEAWGHRFSDKGNNYAARIEDVEYDEMPETEIILDVSGSVSEELLRNFLRQVKTMLKQSQIKVGTFSNEFHGFQVVKKDEDIDKLIFKVGGGTNFDAASKAFTKRKDVNKICFTDGQDGGNAGIVDKRTDIIWITFENPNFKPDNGKVIYVPKSELMCVYKNNEQDYQK